MIRAILIGLVCLIPPERQSKPEEPQERDTRKLETLEAQLIELTNAERDARALSVLEHVPVLSDVARQQSERMAGAFEVSHDLAPESMEERIRNVLPGTCLFGENLAKNTTLVYALSDLMESKGHRANLLHSPFTQIGVGIVKGEDGSLYITQNFARPCDIRQ